VRPGVGRRAAFQAHDSGGRRGRGSLEGVYVVLRRGPGGGAVRLSRCRLSDVPGAGALGFSKVWAGVGVLYLGHLPSPCRTICSPLDVPSAVWLICGLCYTGPSCERSILGSFTHCRRLCSRLACALQVNCQPGVVASDFGEPRHTTPPRADTLSAFLYSCKYRCRCYSPQSPSMRSASSAACRHQPTPVAVDPIAMCARKYSKAELTTTACSSYIGVWPCLFCCRRAGRSPQPVLPFQGCKVVHGESFPW
jgi:hypothetical protein